MPLAAARVRFLKMPSGRSGAGERQLDHEERAEQRRGGREQGERGRVAPARIGRAGHGVHEQHQARGHGDRTRDVEVTVGDVGPALAQEERRRRDHDDADRDVQEEDPRPREVGREHAAEQHAGRAAAARGRAPDAEGAVALAPLGEGRDQDRERGGGQQRAAESLQRAEDDQRLLGPRDAAQERADGEEAEPGDEDTTTPEHVAEAAAEQEEAAEEDRVGADDPLQAGLGEVQVRLDRGQRDVDDRDVEHHHELRRHDDREGEPAAAVGRSV